MYEPASLSIQQITDYMFVPDNAIEADATLVLGMTLWQRPLMKAVELYHQSLAGTLVFSGGHNPKIDGVEALQMMERWTEMELPFERVLIDPKALNTRENMIHCKKLLIENNIFTEQLRINIVAISYHMRRAVETCRSVFGDEVILGVVNYPSVHCQRESWFENPKGKTLILTELEKIFRYLPTINRHNIGQTPVSKSHS